MSIEIYSKKINSFLDYIYEINCIENNLRKLPKLPPNCKSLDFGCNKLKKISKLPNRFNCLCISTNNFVKLPPMPNINKIYLEENKIIYKFKNNIEKHNFLLSYYGNKIYKFELFSSKNQLIFFKKYQKSEI